jgi:hypothetical protein
MRTIYLSIPRKELSYLEESLKTFARNNYVSGKREGSNDFTFRVDKIDKYHNFVGILIDYLSTAFHPRLDKIKGDMLITTKHGEGNLYINVDFREDFAKTELTLLKAMGIIIIPPKFDGEVLKELQKAVKRLDNVLNEYLK